MRLKPKHFKKAQGRMGRSKPIHAFKWVSPKYLLLCGVSNGLISPHKEIQVTCKRCLKQIKKNEGNGK